jgi:hypothetical protein
MDRGSKISKKAKKKKQEKIRERPHKHTSTQEHSRAKSTRKTTPSLTQASKTPNELHSTQTTLPHHTSPTRPPVSLLYSDTRSSRVHTKQQTHNRVPAA